MLEQKIAIAEKRLEEAMERRNYFAKKYRETGNRNYFYLVLDESEIISKIEEAIGNALLKVKTGKEA